MMLSKELGGLIVPQRAFMSQVRISSKSLGYLRNEVLSTTSLFSLKRYLAGRSSHIQIYDNATESFDFL